MNDRKSKCIRIRNFIRNLVGQGEVIASWGEAKLVKHLDGKLELRGGSKEDRGEAREWISLFWHEAVVGDGWGGKAG
ncbi:MAG: hypothetical protein NTX51_16055 [Verrucomicrobia bacterium]|nr:hypothetical protein [Verrucomicrobiota bacterium]